MMLGGLPFSSGEALPRDERTLKRLMMRGASSEPMRQAIQTSRIAMTPSSRVGLIRLERVGGGRRAVDAIQWLNFGRDGLGSAQGAISSDQPTYAAPRIDSFA